jgi:hypothetical protein
MPTAEVERMRMRYSDYEKQLTRLEAAIAAERTAEARAAAGQGNWLDRMMPSRFQAKVQKASGKRAALLRERTRLTRDFFGGPSLVRNVDMAAALHRTISAETAGHLQDLARAAADDNRTAGDGR